MKSNKNKSSLKGPPLKSTTSFPVVGIGASAGGLDAFKRLLGAISENSGMAYVLVQHLSPEHESQLPEILQKVTPVPVLEITDVIKVEPDHIYIIPANKLIVANDGALQLIPRPTDKKNVLNLPIDFFFFSLAQVYQSNAIGVVLSGSASDGTKGLKAIKDAGGITFAQDEESATFDAMPHSAVQAGVVDFILPPEKIPQKLLELITITNAQYTDQGNIKEEDVFRQILSLLRIRKGIDFTFYKQTTIRRRILRRMAFNKNTDPAPYLKFLRENKNEQDILYQDLLIPVTDFFRDPKSFENLTKSVFSPVLKNKLSGQSLRVWVAGCSTGEEAYSIAISLREYLDHDSKKVQIFATDINEAAINKARSGTYSKAQVSGLSAERLRDFFTKTNDGYQIKKAIRDVCVFAVHNFLRDPPFGRLDLISCRNVLIYMEPYLQKKALATFHYSLNPGGFLWLGKSETTSGVPELFSQFTKNEKIFARNDVPSKAMVMATQRTEQIFSDNNKYPKIESVRTDFQKIADDIMLSRFSPAGVVVNEAMEILYFRGSTANYLEQAPGKPSLNLLKMVKQDLSFELRNILHKAKKEKTRVTRENIPVKINNGLLRVTIEAIPLPNTIEPHYLVLFHEMQSSTSRTSKKSPKLKEDEKGLKIQQLEVELAQSRDDMRSITEEQEAANEELQSANEELLSSGEELQSLNEELETGKEELQSTNEELTVVNSELMSLNEQITSEKNFSESIINTLHEPLLVLDDKLRVKICNLAFYKTFLVNEMETEGKLIYDLGNGQWNIPKLKELLEKIIPQKSKFDEFEVRHIFSRIGNRVMSLNAQEMIRQDSSERLILLAIQDITERKQAQANLEEKNTELEHMNKELQSFSYIASHDLQEPLRKIQTFASHLLEKEDQNLSGAGKEYFQRMRNVAERMQSLIEDLLSFSKLGSIEKKFELKAIGEIIEGVKGDLKEIIEEKHAIIDVAVECAIKIIPFQMRQLFQNLIFNSLKFSNPLKPPHIKISGKIIKGPVSSVKNLLPGKKYCHLSIKDNGIGFEPAYNERIFELFQRLHSKHEYRGTGIGLAIVKKIVENHHGMITATGKINIGATFDIYIPA